MVVLLAISLSPLVALGCDCASKLNDTTADVVFEGTAERAIRWNQVGAPDVQAFVRHGFISSVVLKGPDRNYFFVDTSVTDCGYPFEEGKRYRVYAQLYRRSGIEWLVGICSKTAQIRK